MRWHIGTSGYSYAPWKGKFYPPRLPAKEMLGYYAGRFDTVEINSSFYRMPLADTLSAWAAQVPADFRFAFKAPRRITHDRRLRDVAEDTAYFLKTTETLGARRGPLLFQLPPGFAVDRERWRAFLALLPAAVPAAFEFRHASWHDAAIYDDLRARNFALGVTDTDEDGASPLVATAEWGYLRLRRSAYDEAALGDWVARLRALPWREVYVYFKHEDEARGPALAQRLLALTQGA